MKWWSTKVIFHPFKTKQERRNLIWWQRKKGKARNYHYFSSSILCYLNLKSIFLKKGNLLNQWNFFFVNNLVSYTLKIISCKLNLIINTSSTRDDSLMINLLRHKSLIPLWILSSGQSSLSSTKWLLMKLNTRSYNLRKYSISYFNF